jgi:hypothetical protein
VDADLDVRQATLLDDLPGIPGGPDLFRPHSVSCSSLIWRPPAATVQFSVAAPAMAG